MTPQEMMTKVAQDTWHSTVARADKLINTLTDEQLQQEVAPGRNTGTYLVGHLAAVHDHMLSLLDMGAARFPHLYDPFVASPDKSGKTIPSITDLRSNWKEVNETLATHMAKLTPEQWLDKHTSVSAEDFVKEPHRNKLNILVGRTNHLSYHLGQLAFLKK